MTGPIDGGANEWVGKRFSIVSTRTGNPRRSEVGSRAQQTLEHGGVACANCADGVARDGIIFEQGQHWKLPSTNFSAFTSVTPSEAVLAKLARGSMRLGTESRS